MHKIKKIIEKNIENVFMNYILALHFNVYNIYIFKNADDDSRISDWFENYLCFFSHLIYIQLNIFTFMIITCT